MSHTERRTQPLPITKQENRSHLQEFLWVPSVAPGEVDIPTGCFFLCLHKITKRNGEGRKTAQQCQKLRWSQHLPTMHVHVSHSTNILPQKEKCSHAHTPQQISSCTCTHLNAERYQQTQQRHVCTYVTMLLQYSSSVETAEANSGKGDSVKTTGAYHWLLSSEGGWGQKEGGLTVE